MEYIRSAKLLGRCLGRSYYQDGQKLLATHPDFAIARPSTTTEISTAPSAALRQTDDEVASAIADLEDAFEGRTGDRRRQARPMIPRIEEIFEDAPELDWAALVALKISSLNSETLSVLKKRKTEVFQIPCTT